MKKLLIGFLALSLVLLSFVSCNSNAVVTLEGEVGTVSFAELQEVAMKSLSASVEQKSKANLYWRYTAVKQDGAGVIGATVDDDTSPSYPKGVHDVQYSLPVNGSNPGLNSSSNPITFSAGKWTFKLYAFEELGVTDAAKYIYYSETAKEATVSAGKTVTVNVSVTGVSTGEGKIKLTDITIPSSYSDVKLQCRVDNSVNWDEMTESASKWSKDYGTATTFACDQSHTVEVGLFTDDSNSTFISSAIITVSVYRGLYTIVGGSYDELTGGVIINSDIPKPVVTSVSTTAAAASYPGATVVLPEAAPGDSTSSTTTTVKAGASLQKDSSSSAISVAAGDDVKTEVTVIAYDTDAAEAKFGASSGNTIVAALDVTMTVSVTHENVTTSTNVTLFNPAVVVETKIEENLTDITMKSSKDGTTQDSWTKVDAVEKLYEPNNVTTGVPTAYRYYYNSDGTLIFTTDHFSEFQIIIPVYSKIVETSEKFQTLSAAFAAVQDGETIQLLDDCETSSTYTEDNPLKLTKNNVTLDLNGHTLTTNGNYSVWICGNNDVVKNGTINAGPDDTGTRPTNKMSYTIVAAGPAAGEYSTGIKFVDLTGTGGLAVGDVSATPSYAKDVVLENCTITGTNYYAVNVQLTNNSAIIKSGTYTHGYDNYSSGNAVVSGCEAAITIEGGTYHNGLSVYSESGKGNGTISVTGGTFYADPSAYVATGYVAKQSGQTWTVIKSPFASGSGTENDPFMITDKADMQNITSMYDKGYFYYKVANGYSESEKDLTGWTPVYLNGSFDGNGVSFTNVTACLFQNVGYQLNNDTIELKNFTATMNVSAPGQYGAAALVKNIFNAGTTTFTNVNVHGTIEGYWNIGSFYNYGTANYGNGGCNYTVKFENCNSDATLICTSGNTCGGFLGHVYEGYGNSASIYFNNSNYTGTIYTVNAAGGKYFAMSSDYNNTNNHFYISDVEQTPKTSYRPSWNVYSGNVNIESVAPVSGDNGYTVSVHGSAAKILVSVNAQLSAYESDNETQIPNLSGITMVLSSETKTDATSDTVLLGKVTSASINNSATDYGYSLSGTAMTVNVPGESNYRSGTVRLTVTQYDSSGNILCCGTTNVIEIQNT